MSDVETTTVASGFKFLEAPRWHEDRLWFSDFYRRQVFSALEDGADLRTEADVPGQPAGLEWLPDGRLLVLSMRDRTVLRREFDGTLVVHADLGGHATGHANDMVLDRAGRAYVGNFGFDLMSGAPLETTSLCRVDPDGTVTKVAGDMWFPNGSVITPDGVLIVNETFGNRCTAFDLTEDGRLTNRRVWAEFGPLPTEQAMDLVFGQIKVAADGGCLDCRRAPSRHPSVRLRARRRRRADPLCVRRPDFFEAARMSADEATLVAIRVTVPGAQGRPAGYGRGRHRQWVGRARRHHSF